ncbi:MAG: hypothetical protein JW900_11080 [Anaerolineae bacterium]|nr:hypothetical protein [Anaerolineae bacterium]
MSEELTLLQARAEWLQKVLSEKIPQEKWTVHPASGKASLIIEAERGEMNQPGWRRTGVVIPLNMVESLEEDALVQQIRTRVAGYRMMGGMIHVNSCNGRHKAAVTEFQELQKAHGIQEEFGSWV